MAIQKILVPDMGDFKDVEVIEVLVKKGQVIKKNDSLITLESDKSSVEVPSTHEGKVEKINVVEGDFIIFPAHCIHRGLPNIKKRKTIISYNFSIDATPIEGGNLLDLDRIKKVNPNIWHSKN